MPGWNYLLGTGRGLLPGGGSWAALVPPAAQPAEGMQGSQGTLGTLGTVPLGRPGPLHDIHKADMHDKLSEARDARRHNVRTAGRGDFSLVVETLTGGCMLCHVPATTAQTVTFTLTGALLPAPTHLAAWLTNSTHYFIRLPDIAVCGGGVYNQHPRG